MSKTIRVDDEVKARLDELRLPEDRGYSATLRRETPMAHACHCIGCCTKCGQCRTTTTHAATCAEVARLNAERAAVIEAARG